MSSQPIKLNGIRGVNEPGGSEDASTVSGGSSTPLGGGVAPASTKKSEQAMPPTYGLHPVVTVEEAAEFLRCNVKTVYVAIDAKELPARRIGRRIVILREALLQWLGFNERVLPKRRS